VTIWEGGARRRPTSQDTGRRGNADATGGVPRRGAARGRRPQYPRMRSEGGAMRPTLSKIPVTVVTGFLGAGKTTLIRHVLENAAGRRLALIINEFGDVGVDGTILKNCGVDSC